ncbi:MAG: hypothetical protein FJZ43_00040 [Candidatus Staskawiczbacteria bacterium]|nr:hypothetical protein [Candidatus Staskawiczbacteria bacterium]
MLSFVNLIVILGIFWIARTFRNVLFWVYLWQLKEYHIDRFIDHFRTKKGKKIFINYLYLLKVALLVLLIFRFSDAFWPVLLIYFGESLITVYLFAKKSIKIPVATIKTILLVFILLVLSIFYLNLSIIKYESLEKLSLHLIIFDVFLGFFASVIVLLVQPFFVLVRNNTIKKATQKIKRFGELKVIAITGSYGKTSTKEFLKTILSEKFNVLATPDHKNSEIGISQTILNELNGKHDIFIVEMGSYKKGGINLLCDIVKPQIGIVTGVNEQHLATFKSMGNLLSAEGGQELLFCLKKDGLLVVNGDNKYCMDLFKKANIDKKMYSIESSRVDADIYSKEITVDKHFLDFIAIQKGGQAGHFNVNAIGRQNIQNLLGAILIARELGMSFEEISKSAKKILQKQSGIILKKGAYGLNIIDSSYSSNPDGVIADLDYLSIFGGKKVIVMPCLIELGKKSEEVHRQIGKKIATVCDLAIITTEDKFKILKESATLSGMNENNIVLSEKPLEILNLITTFCKSGDAVLLEGRVPIEIIKLLNKK